MACDKKIITVQTGEHLTTCCKGRYPAISMALVLNSGASAYIWNGRNGIMLGHCRNHPIDPAYARTFVVVRITGNEIAVVPWRWDLAEWARRQGWENEQGEHVIIDRGDQNEQPGQR